MRETEAVVRIMVDYVTRSAGAERARCGSGRQQQLKSGNFLVREQLRKEARTAPLFEAARSGGQAPCARSDLQRDLSGEVNSPL